MNTYNTYFKSLATKKALTAESMIIHCLLKAFHSKEQDKVSLAIALIKRSFSPITKQSKLDSGATPYQSLRFASTVVFYWATNKQDNLGPLTPEEIEFIASIKKFGLR